MRIITLLSFLLLISTLLIGQTNSCECFNGIGSSENDKPSLIVEFVNGQKLSVCGYEQKKISENEVLISEFNVFDCKTGKSFTEYGAVQNCQVSFENGVLKIIEFKYLPAGKNWEWKQVQIGLEQIFVKENKLIVIGQKPKCENIKIEKERIDEFFAELDSIKMNGKIENPEEILGKLEILSLNNNQKATTILFDFENYFNYVTDGAIAEQWKDAIATVNWIRK